jgi:hypothetical protein
MRYRQPEKRSRAWSEGVNSDATGVLHGHAGMCAGGSMSLGM